MVLSEIEPVISWNNKKEETKEKSQVQSNCHVAMVVPGQSQLPIESPRQM
jgi:hypothetical protein